MGVNFSPSAINFPVTALEDESTADTVCGLLSAPVIVTASLSGNTSGAFAILSIASFELETKSEPPHPGLPAKVPVKVAQCAGGASLAVRKDQSVEVTVQFSPPVSPTVAGRSVSTDTFSATLIINGESSTVGESWTSEGIPLTGSVGSIVIYEVPAISVLQGEESMPVGVTVVRAEGAGGNIKLVLEPEGAGPNLTMSLSETSFELGQALTNHYVTLKASAGWTLPPGTYSWQLSVWTEDNIPSNGPIAISVTVQAQYQTQWTQIATELQEIKNAETNAQPAIAVVGISGEPNRIFAWKGPNSTDEIHLSGVAPISGATTDAAPALAVLDSYLKTTLYLAWKVGSAVNVRQYILAEDGVPVVGEWAELSSEPAVSTDAAPALAVGVDNKLYMVWKTPGEDAFLAWSVYDGNGWSKPETIPLAKTNTNPAVVGWFSEAREAAVTLCLAWKDANTDDVFWSSFTPGSSSFTQNHVPGASTNAAPALTAGYVAGSYVPYVVWKGKDDGCLSFAPLSGKTVGVITTLMQAVTNAGPAAANWSNYDVSDPEETLNSLILAWKGVITGDVWSGSFNILSDPAPLLPNTQPHTLGSNCNYIMSTNGAFITALSVKVEVTQEIVSANGFGFQLNCFTTKNEFIAWQQYILCIDPSQRLSLAGQVNNWSTTLEIINSGLGWFCPIKGPTPAGTILSIELTFDSSKNQKVTGVTFTATLPGESSKSLAIELKNIETDWKQQVFFAQMSPIVAFQFVFVGKDESTAVLTSGAGNITYTALPPLTAGYGWPSFIEHPVPTGELANSGYSQLPSGSSKTFTQSFATVPSLGWSLP